MNRSPPGAGWGRQLGWLALSLLLEVLSLLPLSAAAPHYSIRGWQTEDGLPGNSVNAIVQTQSGYLWLGTYSGLVRFDGVRFAAFDSDSTPELKTSRITSLYEDPAGFLWIGHETGELTRLGGGSFQSVEVPSSWSGGKTTMIRADEAGAVWLLNKDGLLARVKDGMLISPKEGRRGTGGVVMMARDRQGKLWVSQHGELGTVEGRVLAPCSPDAPGAYVQAVSASRDGGVWVLSSGQLRKWRDGKWSGDLGRGPWGLYAVTAMVETQQGDLAVGTSDQGLFLLTPGGASQHFNRTNGLGSDWVRCICEDREGNLWLGVGNNGLNSLRTVSFERVGPPDHWQGCAVLALTQGRDGSLWFGTEGAGLYRFQAGQWTNFAEADGLNSRFVWSVSEDALGRLWAATWGAGLFLRQGQRFTVAPGLAGVTTPMTALLPGRGGDLWVGTGSGLLRYQEGQPMWLGPREGAASRDVRAIIEDAQGAVWFGMSGGGLGCLQDGELRTFTKADGLSSDFVLCLRAETNGTLWVGTFGGGLCRLKAGHFAKISTREGLANNVICDIEEDGAGDFWMSSERGILRVNHHALEQCADGQISRVSCLAYGLGDGLETTECSGGFQPAGCQTRDGRLWFPTRKGLVALDPGNLRTNPLAPPVVLEEMLVDGRSQSLEPAHSALRTTHAAFLEVPPGRQRFEFRYTALSLTAPEKVRFKYRLQGLEADWVDAGTKRSATYSYLPPDRYVFAVIACNNDGVWNETGAALGFTVLPFFWQIWWFRGLAYLAGVTGAGAGMWFAAKRRHRRKLERLERQRALERERARIAKDIHDDLGASLTRITMLSQSARKDLQQPHLAAAHLEGIYTTGRELTRALDEIVWAVNPKHDTLDSVATYLVRFAQDFLSAASIRCRLDLPLQLPSWPLTAEIRHNLFLAFKEALHNVVKHAAASEVIVSLALAPAAFRLRVEDDGRGFQVGEHHAAPQPDSDRPGAGNGLDNMRRRLEDIGGHCRIESSPGKGTKVNFEVETKRAGR